MNESKLSITQPSSEYELIDSGEGEKLERYGAYIISRPDPQALWSKQNPEVWETAHARFEKSAKGGKWHTKQEPPKDWSITLAGLTMNVALSPFKHTGVFPEQSENWKWIHEKISGAVKAGRKISVINLFGYTGGATLAAAKAGADVCHVDGSKASIGVAKENAKLSGLDDKPIRWILDDVKVFVNREITRGKQYDVVIMDPPIFGHGPKKEVWKIEEDLPQLMKLVEKILSPDPLFILMNGYASGYSAIAYKNNLADIMKEKGGVLESGELAIEDRQGRLLPAGIFARWFK